MMFWRNNLVCETKVLRVSEEEELLKLVVFVPQGHEHNVRNAASAAGAGWIGNYSHCSFYTTGTGTFMPGAAANPYLGEQGKLESNGSAFGNNSSCSCSANVWCRRC